MLPEDHPQFHPLPPAGKPSQSGDVENPSNVNKLPKSSKPTRSSKFLVYLLLLTVLLAVPFLGFAVVVRPKTPQFRITDIAAKNMSVKRSNATGDPSTVSLKGTLVATVEIGNPNFGRFDYGNGTLTVVYGEGVPVVLGQELVVGGHVSARGTRRMDLRIAVGSDGRLSGSGYKNFSDDVGSRLVYLECVGTLRGRVYWVWNKLKRWKTCDLNCTMRLDLSTMTIQGLDCK